MITSHADCFQSRAAAGRALARILRGRRLPDPVVLALPRGGVPVAVEVALALHAPLDLIFVRRIGTPRHRELAAAAIVDGEAPEIVFNEDTIAQAGVGRARIEAEGQAQLAEIERQRAIYQQGRPTPPPLGGRDLIVIDDGIATGTSIRAALIALRRKQPRRLILAVPVAPAETIEELRASVDEVICLRTPEPFMAVGLHYDDFGQVSDQEVVRLLAAADAAYRLGGAVNEASTEKAGA